MTIPVMHFSPLSMEEASPGYFGLKNLQQGLMQNIQNMHAMQQQKAQQQMQQQQQQLFPLQMKKMQEDIAMSEAKRSGLPMEAKQKSILAQRAQDNKLLELVGQNSALLNDPAINKQVEAARGRVSQPLDALIGMQPGLSQIGQPAPSILQAEGMQPDASQKQAQPELMKPSEPVDFATSMRLREEHKNMPADIKNQQTRSVSASIMLDNIKNKLEKLEPFFGPKNSLSKAFRTYAANTGLSDDEAARQYNTLKQDILIAAGEVAAGMTKSRAESTIKEWQNITNPIKTPFIGFNQVMDNLNSLENSHKINQDTLFYAYPESKKQSENFIKEYTKKQDQQASNNNLMLSHSEVQAELKRRGIR